jgi:hypothetical protein
MTAQVYLRKEIAALPVPLDPNTIYAIRSGVGFDLYISDSLGNVAHKVNNTDDPLKNPVFTYTNDSLTGISYSDGSTKILSYDVLGQLSQVDLIQGLKTTRKVFNYVAGKLHSINETVF